MTRGHRGSLFLRCRAFSSLSSCRFIPAHPTFTAHRSARSAPSYTPAASPRLRRRLSARPPHRLLEPAPELTRLLESGHALHPGPYPPDWSRRHRYGASPADSLALRLLTLLAGPGPSGSTSPSRRCRGCSRPPRRSPDQAASSFTRPLRRPGGGALPSPHEYTAPRGARKVGPGRGTGLPASPFPRTASRTRRASRPRNGLSASPVRVYTWPSRRAQRPG